MPKRLQEQIYGNLRDKNFKSDDELYLYLILQVATIFAGGIHLLLFILMTACHVSWLPVINLVSVAIFVANWFILVRKRSYAFCGFLISIEVIVYCHVASFIIGADNYNVLYLILVLVMQIIIPYTKPWIRAIMVAVTWGSSIVVLLIGERGGALFALDSGYMLAISIVNLSITAIGIVLELLIGNAIKRMIVHFNENHMQELSTQANTDPLTNLYNRRYAEMLFEQYMTREPGEARCFAMLDIDDFKTVNDTHGHGVGDEVLTGLTEIMLHSLRRTDTVIRWGGEEFLIVLGGVDLDLSHEILDKMRRNIQDTPMQTAAGPIHITVTIGVACMDVQSIHDSIDACDAKLYEGKQGGKNVVVK